MSESPAYAAVESREDLVAWSRAYCRDVRRGWGVDVRFDLVDWEISTVNGQSRRVPAERPIRAFPNMTAAQNYVQQDGTAQVGGVGTVPGERVPAM